MRLYAEAAGARQERCAAQQEQDAMPIHRKSEREPSALTHSQARGWTGTHTRTHTETHRRRKLRKEANTNLKIGLTKNANKNKKRTKQSRTSVRMSQWKGAWMSPFSYLSLLPRRVDSAAAAAPLLLAIPVGVYLPGDAQKQGGNEGRCSKATPQLLICFSFCPSHARRWAVVLQWKRSGMREREEEEEEEQQLLLLCSVPTLSARTDVRQRYADDVRTSKTRLLLRLVCSLDCAELRPVGRIVAARACGDMRIHICVWVGVGAHKRQWTRGADKVRGSRQGQQAKT